MKKRIISLLLAVITVMQIVPWTMLPIIAEGDENAYAITVEDMEVGKLYTAEFISDEFWPAARFHFTDTYYDFDESPYVSELPAELTVVRESEFDFDYVYVTDNTAGWPEKYAEYRYVDADDILIGSGISLDEMEIGTEYMAVWNTEVDFVITAKKIPDSEAIYFEPYGNDYMSNDGFPKDLVVKLVYADDDFVYVTNEDWPEAFDQYRYLDPEYDIIITGEYVEPEDDGYIHGKVDIFCDEAEGGVVTLQTGGKVYAFTKFDDEISKESAKYQWQIKLEDGRWATVGDYIYPYAVLSEALLVNNPSSTGRATLRCIVTDGSKKYASDEIALQMATKDNATEQLSSMNVDSYNAIAPMQKLSSEIELLAEGEEAFQITIEYKYLHENPADPKLLERPPTGAGAFTVTVPSGQSYGGDVDCPPVIGYKPYLQLESGETYNPNAGHIEYTLSRDENGNPQKAYFKPVTSVKIPEGTSSTWKKTVYYIPQTVTFFVNYHQQKLIDDTYDLFETVKVTGIADSFVGENLQFKVSEVGGNLEYGERYDGFVALFYDSKIQVDRNGNTHVDIYYDREYYIVDFKLDEGYGVNPYYVRYGTELSLGLPTKPGYTFNSWKLIEFNGETSEPDGEEWPPIYKNAKPTDPIKIQDNLKYQAVWDISTTTYTVIYWLENADDNNFTLTTFRVIENAIPGAVINASDVQDTLGDALAAIGEDGEEDHFVFLEGVSDTQVSVKGDGTTAVNVYYARKYYTINFTSTGRCAMYVENGNSNYSHTHGTGCERDLLCSKEAHTHTDACGDSTIICNMVEHTSHTKACCTRDEHAHSSSCFENVGNSTTNNTYLNGAPSNPKEGQIYRRSSRVNRVIYINGRWYLYSGTESSGTIKQPNANCPGLHTHGDGSCVCATPVHTHTDTCYKYSNCDKTAHTHSDGCYSECKKYVHTCGTNCSNANRTNSVKVVTQKYDSDISKIWPIVDASGTNHQGYVWESSITGDYYSILYKMPNADMTMSRYQFSGSTQLHWYYALERLTPTTEYEGENYVTNGGKYYYVAFETYLTATTGTNLTYDEDYFSITGFTQLQTKNQFSGSNWTTNNGYREMYLYYVRNKHNLIFHDGEREIQSTPYLYEASLADAFFVPENIPLSKEQGSVKFAGWYTTPTCADGTEFDFANEVMPDRDVTLYAKWEDMTYSVEVYLDEKQTEMATPHPAEKHGTSFPLTVPFGERITEPNHVSDSDSYTFAGWYYRENGVEKRFDFATMTIKKDYLKSNGEDNTAIYAKWTSQVPVEFTIKYHNENGEDIADPTTGVSLAGVYKTFNAAIGDDIYPQFRKVNEDSNGNYEIYIPSESSYTMEIKPEEDGVNPNVYVFQYTTTDKIEYTIKHVFVSDDFEKILGRNTFELSEPVVIKSNNEKFAAQISVEFRTLLNNSNKVYDTLGNSYTDEQKAEVWKIITGLSPDAYERTFIITSNSVENVVEFNWKSAGLTGMYQVLHYVQGLEDVGNDGDPSNDIYSLFLPQEFLGDYGDEYDAVDMKVPGFKLNTDLPGTVQKGTLVKPTEGTSITNGLVLKLYYTREEYDYTVKHIYADGTQGKEETKSVRYQTTVTEVASPKNDNYSVVGDKSQTVEIVSDGLQEIVFTYDVKKAYFFYQIMNDNGGILSPLYNETVSFENGAKGTTPIASEGFVFEGWYVGVTDNDGHIISYRQVENDDATVDTTTNMLVPKCYDALSGKSVYFFAKFIPTTRTFKNDNLPENSTQAVVYRLKGKDGTATAGVDVTFTIIGNGSAVIAMLPYGEYTVTVLDWAWRYDDPSLTFDGENFASTNGSFDLTLDTVGDVTFTFSASSNNKWLTDDAIGIIG